MADLNPGAPPLFGPIDITINGGEPIEKRSTVNLIGNIRGTDNAEADRYDITITGGGSTGGTLTLATASGSIGLGDALCPSTIESGTYVKATTANVALANGVISAIATQARSGGEEITAVFSGVLPEAFFAAGATSGLIVNASGAVVRGQLGRNVGWTDAAGNAFFHSPPIQAAGLQHVLDAQAFGAIAGDSASGTRTANVTALQAVFDAGDFDSSSFIGRRKTYLPGGIYFLDNGLSVRRRAIIEGDGGGAESGGTELIFPDASPGLTLHSNNAPSAGNSDWCSIRDITLRSEGTSGTSVGVQIHSISRLENVGIGNFFNGVKIDGGAGVPPGFTTTADFVFLQNVRVAGGKGYAFHVDSGGDNNGCVFINCDARYGGTFAESLTGGDFWDDPFLGNVYLGCSSNSEVGAYKVRLTGGANGTSWFGCYFEGGSMLSSRRPAQFLETT